MKVSLVRHTSVELDGNFTCYGALDVEVNPTFEQEAKGAKERIEGLQPDGVFTSPLQRAVKLATYCGYGHAERDDRLREMNFGAWEGKPLSDQQLRVRAFLEEKKLEGFRHILLFCHGGVINCARTLVGETSIIEAFASLPGFASHTLIEY